VQTRAQQTAPNFSPAGSAQYKEKIAQLEKYAVPKIYPDKESQKWYEDIKTGNNKSLLQAFKDDDLIYDTLLLNKCNGILNRIIAGNKNFRFDTIKVYISRSISANAACWGEGTLMVNAGLFLWVDNDDELALVLAHEIAHQLLNHVENKIKGMIATLTSDELKQEIKNIKKADYGKYERLKKLMKGMSIETGKHSVYKESEADSLGVILIKNANFNISNASRILLKLDHVDELFTSDKLYVLKDIIDKAPVDLSYFNVKTKYNGLSNVAITMNADKDFDSIKTHPDCIKRFETIAGKGTTAATVNCCMALNGLNGVYKENAMMEMVRYLYENNSIGFCIHLSVFALKNNYSPSFYNYFLSLCFSKLYDDDKKLERFNAVNMRGSRGTNAKELQDYLFAAGIDDLKTLAGHFLSYKIDPNSEDYEFAKLMYNTQVHNEDETNAYASYTRKFPKSKYLYLIQKKEK
jgi:hypothetical protein